MIFWASTDSAPPSAVLVASAVATGAAGASASTGATGAGFGGSAGVRRREIGGRIAARFTVLSPSVRFGFGFFSSINETVSARGTAALAGSDSLAGASVADFAPPRGVLATIFGRGVCLSASGVGFVTLLAPAAGFVSLPLVSGAVERDGAAAFTGFRAGAVLRAVLFVVVFVAI